jgi:hypothetical protein
MSANVLKSTKNENIVLRQYEHVIKQILSIHVESTLLFVEITYISSELKNTSLEKRSICKTENIS